MGILGSIIPDIFGKIGDVVGQVVVDKDKKIALQVELEKLRIQAEADAEQRIHEELLGQIETNKLEAQHRSIFIAGWRPFIGWGCGGALIYNTLIAPFIEFVARLFGWTGAMPVVDISFLTTVLLAMLGMGVMRSYDKLKGTSNDFLKGQ